MAIGWKLIKLLNSSVKFQRVLRGQQWCLYVQQQKRNACVYICIFLMKAAIFDHASFSSSHSLLLLSFLKKNCLQQLPTLQFLTAVILTSSHTATLKSSSIISLQNILDFKKKWSLIFYFVDNYLLLCFLGFLFKLSPHSTSLIIYVRHLAEFVI